jgi:RsiW-degrading membrane proteinase PrsW (M82 family)
MNGYYCLVTMATLLLSLMDDCELREEHRSLITQIVVCYWLCPGGLFIAWNIVVNTMPDSRDLHFLWDCTWTFLAIFAFMRCGLMEHTFKSMSRVILVILGAKLTVNLF